MMKYILMSFMLSSTCVYAQEPVSPMKQQPASPQQAAKCSNSMNIAKMLKEQYGEIPTEAGITQSKDVLTLFTGPSSWTLVGTRPSDGMTCIIEVGKNWLPIGSHVPELPSV